MKKCSVCGKEILSSQPQLLTTDESGNDCFCCDLCYDSIYILLNQKNSERAKFAKTHLCRCMENLTDQFIKNKLDELISGHYEPTEPTESSFWTSKLRVIFKIIFAIIVIIGIILGYNVFGLMNDDHPMASAFLFLAIIFLSLIIGVVTIGMQMVFLNIADDIHKIEQHLRK